MEINLVSGIKISGDHPVVIIGPNGSGKTTFGSELARINNAEWISATRNLQFEDSIVMQTPESATRDVINITTQQRSSPWMLSNELNQLLAKLKAEDSQEKVFFANNYKKGTSTELVDTKLDKLSTIWASIFPKRVIDFSSYSPKVKAAHVSDSLFGISRMSGGERVALYLLARVLDAPQGLIFIDEPEIHFHGVLARKFWNELELLRNDCRFIYITHDLPFATSRHDVQFVIVRSPSDYTIMEQEHGLPDDVVESILGAATFSVSAKRIIFCESDKIKKWDDAFYTAWFKSESTAVIPVGSCVDVIKCVEAFNDNPVVKGMKATGIIDRDFYSDDYLSTLSEDIHVLPVHEIESLFSLKDVFLSVGEHLGKTKSDLEIFYDECINIFVEYFNTNDVNKNKVILERVKQKTIWQSKSILNSVRDVSKPVNIIKSEYLEALKLENWSFSPEVFFDEEVKKINKVLVDKDIEKVLTIFPGKILFSTIVKKLGIDSDTYLSILILILNKPELEIAKRIANALQSRLPLSDE